MWLHLPMSRASPSAQGSEASTSGSMPPFVLTFKAVEEKKRKTTKRIA